MKESIDDAAPLWLVNCLLANNVFGLPGGHESSIRGTVGSLQRMARLATRIHAPVVPTGPTDKAAITWKEFLASEGRKRYATTSLTPVLPLEIGR